MELQNRLTMYKRDNFKITISSLDTIISSPLDPPFKFHFVM